jgi:hypothetical protein
MATYELAKTNLNFGNEVEGTHDRAVEVKMLPTDYILDEKDVLCGRGKKCFQHGGNENFRILVQSSLRAYIAARTKTDKTSIIRQVINVVREQSPNGGFVKYDPLTGRYYEVGDTMAVSIFFLLIEQLFFSDIILT